MRTMIANGNKIIALAALDAGCRLYAGYPITPSSEVMHEIATSFPKEGRIFFQAEDEDSAVLVALGASASGVKSMTNTSGPGMSRKSEQFGFAYMAEIPLVVIDVMRGGPSTGLPTRPSQGDVLFARNPTHGDIRSIVLAPGSVEECYTETIRAFNLAELSMQPIIVLSDETLGHMTRDVTLPDLKDVEESLVARRVNTLANYQPYDVTEEQSAILNPFFTHSQYHITGLTHDKTGFPTEDLVLCQALMDRLFRKVDAHLGEIEKYEKYLLDDAEYLVICYGSVSLSAKEAIQKLRKGGIKVGMFRPITLWPSPEKRMYELAKRFDQKNILVAEMNKGQYLREVERCMGNRPHFLSRVDGRPINPEQIEKKMKEIHYGL